MKLYYKVIVLFLSGLIFWSCEETEFTNMGDEVGDYVAFRSAAGSFPESSSTTTADGETTVSGNTFTVELFRSTSNLDTDLTVGLNSSVVYASSSDFANAGDSADETVVFSTDISSLVIPAGKASIKFNITALNDLASAGDKIINLSISSVSDASFNIGREGLATSSVITVVDDDCPIDLAGDFVGSYTLSEVFSAGGNAGFSFGFVNVTDLTADPSSLSGTGAFLTAGAGTAGGDDFWLPQTPLEFVTCPQTLAFDSNPLILGFTVNGATATYNILSTSYSVGKLTFIGNLGNTGGSNFGEYTVILEKN